MRILSFLLFVLFSFCASADSFETGCWFLRDAAIKMPVGHSSVQLYDFKVYASDLQRVAREREVFSKSIHFLKTELGWKFPYTRKEFNLPVLEVHFISAAPEFTGTVLAGPVIVLNEAILSSPDFAAYWIHYLAHASGMMYRESSAEQDKWFYEATAGWLEEKFGKASKATKLARNTRRLTPQVPLTSREQALGSSLLLDLLAKPYRDVIRQIWEQWSFAKEERLMDAIGRVLRLNHLPPLESYLLNHFLRVPVGSLLVNNTMNVVLEPYSAAVFQEDSSSTPSGGVRLLFQPGTRTATYSAGLIYHRSGESEGILSLKETQRNSWSILVPYSARYKLILVNSSNEILRGTMVREFDSSIPAVLDYFRANEDEEGGVQLEWKTARENGVAFWNLYRIQNGTKERLNAMPIPASVDSPEGLNYVFFDHSNGSLYSLEAITGEGFPSSMGLASTNSPPQNRRSDLRD